MGNVGDARHDEALLAVALPNDGAGLPHEQGADTAGSVRPLFLELARLARAEDFSIDLTRRKRAAVGGQAALRLAGRLPAPPAEQIVRSVVDVADPAGFVGHQHRLRHGSQQSEDGVRAARGFPASLFRGRGTH